ncbi:antirestriction protein ArdA [Pseudomonas lalucatii]|uniref:antirestriction protein ArdA n=1 Tax=Pseudomonas lalucatii TaxID=1424203 RepID=UPI001FE59710|nr:antirestriction protein ArdA [Pseudomonas lalucatii]
MECWKLGALYCEDEYAIHDFEGYRLGEYAGLESAHEIACLIEEYPEFGGALFVHFNDLEQARKAAEEDYCGCYTSLADYAQDLRTPGCRTVNRIRCLRSAG